MRPQSQALLTLDGAGGQAGRQLALPDGAYPVATDLLRRHGSEIDALVCGSDAIAIGALRAANECGVRVPEDLALTGWDDIPFARDLEPPLTTVHVPKELLGAVAARRLIERIARPDLEPIIQMVPTTLVVRASCGAPPNLARTSGRS